MKENFSYPLNMDWTTEEIIAVMEMWQLVEQAYESRAAAEDILTQYRLFKTIVRSVGEERQLGREFEELTGYSLYRVVKAAKKQQTGVLKKEAL
ncbi:UPF0223 family protein [Vagococcus acidifermentans]|uniref:Uncharacterized protein n=1 Tax=Vagococcus acidifermentans TaxID=564710 RepID=A0A430AVS3_9ENTE|nr:UPF0223 family protein [Vagococcus acidifermentans]RSU12149.1 hypothetical protein CBF27_06925 [Vagococcus acidifermentans]